MKTGMVRVSRLMAGLALCGALFAAATVPAAAQGRGPGHGPGQGPRPTPPAACTGGTGSIAGTVTDAAGAAVEGATVHAGGPSRAEATTAADGSYTLASLCAGDYRVGADKQGVGAGGYDADADGKPDAVTLTDDALAATGINIVIAPCEGKGPGSGPGPGPGPRPGPGHEPPASCTGGTDSISGTIKDAAGNPVEGAKVHAKGPTRAEATTAADGSYTLTDLCAGEYRVNAEKQGVGGGGYDADGDGKPDAVTLSDTAPNASGIDLTLKVDPRGGHRRP